MFTGLIRDLGEIVRVEYPTPYDRIISIKTKLPANDLEVGASIACDGVCLTVTDYHDGIFKVQAAAETIAVTNVGLWDVGVHVNLEPSLRAGDALGGHIVSGHVDAVALVRSVSQVGDGHRIEIVPPTSLQKYMAVKGSVAVDGISLTINEVGEDWFSVHIIPHTWAHTTLHKAGSHTRVHIEIDPIARYVERLLESR